MDRRKPDSGPGKPLSICSETCRKTRRNRQQLAWRRRVDCPDRLHGSISGYGTYGCRCDSCREANTSYTRDKRAKGKSF
jgi:hypothetical protein